MVKKKVHIKVEGDEAGAELAFPAEPLNINDEAPALLPLSRPTASLNVGASIAFSDEDIVRTYVPSKHIHAQLYAAEQGYREKYSQLYQSSSATTTLNAANIVTAGLSVLYSDASLDEGYIGNLDVAHMPVRVPITTPQYTFNVASFFDDDRSYEAQGVACNKWLRNYDFNDHLQRRIKDFRQYKERFLFSTTTLTSVKGFGLEVVKGNFHETFHHSEQAVMEFFSTEEGKKFIVSRLQELHARSVGWMILDLYSTRYLCENCNVHLIGFQNSHTKGALYDITQHLHGKGVSIDTPRKGLLWSTRVSASDAGKGTSSSSYKKAADEDHTHEISHDDRHIVLQANSDRLGLPAKVRQKGYSLDTFSGDFFTSRVLSDKKSMEKALGKRECFR